jgi:hypothetical protein
LHQGSGGQQHRVAQADECVVETRVGQWTEAQQGQIFVAGERLYVISVQELRLAGAGLQDE